MRGKPRTLSRFPTRLINPLENGHSCKVPYICNKRSTHVRYNMNTLLYRGLAMLHAAKLTGLDKQKNQLKIVNISLPRIFSICFGCLKEPSH